MRRALGVLPSPLWGGVGGGGPSADHRPTPTPAQRSQACAGCASLPACADPPHKGEGRTEFAARADPTAPEYALARNEYHLHLRVGELAALDDDVVVERDRAVAHRHVVMSLGRALAAALGVGTGGEQKISGKAARAGVVALGVGAVERDRVPAPLRVVPPAEMRDGMTVEVVGARLVALEPVVHELGIEAALDLADESVADVEPHLVLHVTAIGQHDNVAGGEHHGAVGRAFVRKGMHVAGAPVVEAAGLLRISVLNHGRVFAQLDREISAAGARDAHGLGPLQPLAG